MNRSLCAATIVSRREVARDAWLVDFDLQLEAPVHAGQFAMVHPLDGACLLPRPYSILDAVEGRMSLYVKEVGRGSRALVRKPEGQPVEVFAPLGRPFPLERFRGREVILVAGGVGLVPLWKLRRELLAAKERPPLALFGARTPADLPRPLLEGWRLHVEEGADAEMEEGRVTRGLDAAIRQRKNPVVALCGPAAMMEAGARIARHAGAEVWLCLEEQMACGAGVCRSCALPAADGTTMKTVCHDGPVFSFDEIAHD